MGAANSAFLLLRDLGLLLFLIPINILQIPMTT